MVPDKSVRGVHLEPHSFFNPSTPREVQKKRIPSDKRVQFSIVVQLTFLQLPHHKERRNGRICRRKCKLPPTTAPLFEQQLNMLCRTSHSFLTNPTGLVLSKGPSLPLNPHTMSSLPSTIPVSAVAMCTTGVRGGLAPSS